MCGISAYIGEKEAVPILLEGIKRLEYRGYDSCGVATIFEKELVCRKGAGKIKDVNSKLKLFELKGCVGIAQTRWATHGEPNDVNAHPHFSENKEIAIVHNGIIENASSLRKVLREKGYNFRSKTDSEVVAFLIEDLIKEGNSMGDAFMKALKLVEGAFAIVAINRKKPHKLYVAKQSSPLVLGIANDGLYVASDILPIQKYTRKVVYLQDGDVGILTKSNYSIRDLSNVDVNRDVNELNEEIEETSIGNFEHFMLKEIHEQPKTIHRAFRGRIDNDTAKFGGLNISEKELKRIKRIILVGCGTSWHACLVGGYLLEDIAKIPSQVEYASEFRYKKPVLKEDDLLVVLSQSGETADSIAAINEAKKKGVKTIGLVNSVGSSIARLVDGGIYLHAGQEIGVASTKTFTSHLAVLYLLSVYLGRLNGSLDSEKAKEMLNELEGIPGIVSEMLKDSSKIEEVASKYFEGNNALYLGRHYNFPIALEGALKLKEISYIHAEGYPAAEMKHGPIALIDENMPVVVIAPEGRLYSKILSNIEEVKSRRGKVIVITTNGLEDGFDEVIKIPKVSDYLMPLVSVIPVQLLSYYVAKKRGCDIDKPRNLAKSVTVE
ncbi:glutamine--fructose-6-phosphate transaminase (isomerizing) [archaeon]|nr:glutamine--fructose-6-phosphate transaminase (isomerizing) [archaeon]